MFTLPFGLMDGTSVGSTLAFHALTPDDTTYEMLGVKTGTGDLTTTHADTLYAPDHEGVQRAFSADEPVWSGGRVVKNYAFDSEDLTSTHASTFLGGGSASSANSLTTTSAGTAYFNFVRSGLPADPTNVVAGETIVYSVDLWATGADIGKTVNMIIYGANFSTQRSVAQITLTGTRTRYSISWTADADAATLNVGIDQRDLWGVGIGTAEDWFCDRRAWSKTNGQALPFAPEEYHQTTSARTTKVYANANGNTVTDNVVTEAVGAPLPEMPYLQYYPAATNLQDYSNDITQRQSGGAVLAQDAVGINGVPNNATTVSDNDAGSALFSATLSVPTFAGTPSVTARTWIKKETSAVPYMRLHIDTLGGSPRQLANYYFNPQTGDLSAPTYELGGSGWSFIEIVDAGDWWIIVQQTDMNGTQNGAGYTYYVYPAWSSTVAGTQDATLTGSIIVGQTEVYENKTIAEVRGLGPVFTTSAAVSVAAPAYSFDVANLANEASWYAEWVASYSETETGASVDNRIVRSNNDVMYFRSSDPTRFRSLYAFTDPVSYTPDVMNKIGATYYDLDPQQAPNFNGTWGLTQSLASAFATNLRLFVSGDRSHKLRNLQRYDITSYQGGKDIIDGLMESPAFIGGDIIDLTVGDT